ncbi:MAG: FAD-dependent oxidoreductase [Planctomycetia bacterium]|nr:FAD-dependent oxidoreductase [Planctomycetia bacterium]
MQPNTRRIVILGGGFGGVYTARALERALKNDPAAEVSLISKENYFTFHTMLPEVISGEIGLLDTVSPLHGLLPRTRVYVREIESVDLERKVVRLQPGFARRIHEIPYDHLVIALGNVTDFRGLPGLHEHAMSFKSLADAISLRNHLIHVLEEASVEIDPLVRRELLTFVVAGGGFSGVEVCAELNDFVRKVARERRVGRLDELRVVLLHSGERILEREVPASLGKYAEKILRRRGIDLRLNTRLVTASPAAAILSTGERIPCRTLVSTVPSAPHPLIAALDLPQNKGKITVDGQMRVTGCNDVWALGDCALIPLPSGGFAPPTAQHAVREATLLAHNILATLHGREMKTFAFAGLGKLGALGRRSAVAELMTHVRLSGILAWFAWRTIYWFKLPGFGRKVKVGLSWALDLLLPTETVQLRLNSPSALSQLHYEPGEAVFLQNDVGDAFYMILDGEVEISREDEGQPPQRLAVMRAGEFFGEMALLGRQPRSATVRALTPLTVLALRGREFHALVDHIPNLRGSIEQVMERRGAPVETGDAT